MEPAAWRSASPLQQTSRHHATHLHENRVELPQEKVTETPQHLFLPVATFAGSTYEPPDR